MPSSSSSSSSESLSSKYHLIVFFLLYFVQGMPYGLQTGFLPIFFRVHGMSLTNVTLYRLLLIPWVLKAFWAPLIDSYGSKHSWLTCSMGCLSVVCVVGASISPSYVIQLAIIMILFNLVTSVQDIALDSIVIERLTPVQLAKGNIAQVVGYKTGSLFSGGVFALLTETVSWGGIFYGLSFIYLMGFICCVLFIPQNNGSLSDADISALRRRMHRSSSIPGFEDRNSVPHVPPPVQENQYFYCYFWKIFDTEGTSWLLLFVITYKIGEQGIANMFPMYLLDKSISPKLVGFWTGFIGQASSVLGSIVGGLYIHERIFKSLKSQLILRGVSAFVLLASVLLWNYFFLFSYAFSIASFQMVFFSGGAITTITYTLIMLLSKQCPRQCRASHYTTLATGDILGRILFAAAVGSLAQHTSFSFVFCAFAGLCFIAILAMSLAPYAIQNL